jgi:hypothetical protein
LIVRSDLHADLPVKRQTVDGKAGVDPGDQREAGASNENASALVLPDCSTGDVV